MTAVILDGRALAARIKDDLKSQIEKAETSPCLALIRVGDDPASEIYVARKAEACITVGIKNRIHHLESGATQEDLHTAIRTLNEDADVHGILLQLPLPAHLNANAAIQMIDPRKDVDGLTAENMGLLMMGEPRFVPCTPQGVLHMLKETDVNLSGKHAAIIGRSLLFGKPMGQVLLAENCTVTQCHSKTQNLAAITSQADIVIAAVGQANLITADHVKNGAIVIDVGITRIGEKKITGDVDFQSVKEKAAFITPVPGGVGPMTVACLLKNTWIAFSERV